MAEARFSKGSDEWVMFTDFWALCQKYWIPEGGDEYWDRVIKDAGAFCDSHNGHIFARKIAVAFLGYLEEEAKKKK